MIMSSFPRDLDEKYGYITSWKSYKERFFQLEPSITEITANYLKAKQHYESLVNSSQYKSMLQELELSLIEETALDQEIEKEIINKIQSSGSLWQYMSSDKSLTMTVNQEQAKNIYNGWQKILSMASQHQWRSVNTQLERIKQMSDNLLKEINSNSKLINMDSIVGVGQSAKSSTIANSVQGTLSALRGAVLEEEVKKFLSKRLPKESKIKAYQTGAITSGGASIKEDLIVLLDNLELVDENGQVNYIFKNGEIFLADGITTTEKVVLTKYQLEQLRNAPSLGFTAKTSKGQTVFHGGYNINTLIDDSVDAGAMRDKVYQLGHMYQLGISHKATIYQNYAVSKITTSILGVNNAFMVSRSGIIPTYKYIDRLMSNNKYLSFANKEIPKRSKGANIIRKYGSTNIIGPHI